jgi:predicted nucleic acid-binding Zn ribbon protein
LLYSAGEVTVPTYTFLCRCGAEADHIVRIASRHEPQDCESCGGQATAEYQFPDRAHHGTERKVGDARIITDERQIEGGPDWRNQGTNRREGGAGDKLFFYR